MPNVKGCDERLLIILYLRLFSSGKTKTKKNALDFFSWKYRCYTNKAIKQSKDNNEIPILHALKMIFLNILNQVWGMNFVTGGFADFYSKK